MISKNAERLIKERYANKNESPEDVFKRVAKAISMRDDKFEKWLYNSMAEGVFFPNSPCIKNAGKKKGMLHACFTLPLSDSVQSIFETLTNMAVIFQKGGGCGVNFSALRPKNASLSGGGTSSGALSFMGVYDATIQTVKQGGWRRGACMGILDYDHPEILDFCRAKIGGRLQNFNLSVLVTNEFMEKASKGGSVDLIHEDKKYGTMKAKDILDLVSLGSYVCGDPALLFFDRINKDNRLYPETKLKITNPCSEVSLPEYGACCLGSVNLSKFVEGNNFNFDKFYEAVRMVSRALLNMNAISFYPLPQITRVMHELNPIGVGLMGFSDTLIMLGIKYDSEEALNFIDQISKPYIKGTDEVAPDSFYNRIIAPTGSLSILADCSHSIEPIYARSYERHVVAGVFKERKDIYDSEFCRTALEINPEWHLKIQAKFQTIVNGGISKTINLPNEASVDDIKKIYISAWKMGVKGVTVFREGSIDGVLVNTENKGTKCDDVCHL